MVAHVEPSSQSTFVVSFPRPHGRRAGHARAEPDQHGVLIGRPQLVADTLKANFDIDVNHYLEVNFKSFQEIVNAIGYVRVYLPGRTAT